MLCACGGGGAPPRSRIGLAVAAPADPPGLLSGAPLRATGLRLLVADDPPFVLDVDRGAVTRVTGLPHRRRVVTVVASGSLLQGQLARQLPEILQRAMVGLDTDAQRALQFVRSTPGIGTALVGMKQADHVRDNMALARIAPLSPDQIAKLFA